MNFKLGKKQSIILAIISILVSRALFLLIDDPEGPNLLIVMVGAVIVYVVLLIIYTLAKTLKIF